MAPHLFTLPEAAERLNVTPRWLRSRVEAGTVPHRRLGRYIRFSNADLTAIVKAAQAQRTQS